MTPPPDPALLAHNLDALQPAHPDLALRLASFDLTPFNPQPALTRDGQLSYRLTRPDGKTYWLGRSSVPGVRASVLMEQFDPGQGNVLLPGIGEGTEIETLLTRLKPPRTVFVWESELINIRLTLALHDFSAGLRAGRLVLLNCVAADLTSTLVNWLVSHPGVPGPTRIMLWPWQSQADAAQCRIAVEAALHQCAAAK